MQSPSKKQRTDDGLPRQEDEGKLDEEFDANEWADFGIWVPRFSSVALAVKAPPNYEFVEVQEKDMIGTYCKPRQGYAERMLLRLLTRGSIGDDLDYAHLSPPQPTRRFYDDGRIFGRSNMEGIMESVKEFDASIGSDDATTRAFAEHLVLSEDGTESMRDQHLFFWRLVSLSDANRKRALVDFFVFWRISSMERLKFISRSWFYHDDGRAVADFAIVDADGDDPLMQLILEFSGLRRLGIDIAACHPTEVKNTMKSYIDFYERDMRSGWVTPPDAVTKSRQKA